jgi:hypothetical protein
VFIKDSGTGEVSRMLAVGWLGGVSVAVAVMSVLVGM